MEKRHLKQKPIIRWVIHVFPNVVTVIYDVTWGEHYAFRKTFSSWGILHVDDVMLGYCILNLLVFLVVVAHSQKEQLIGVIHSAVLFLTDMEDEFQMRELFSHKMSSCTAFKFRNKFVYNVKIACIPESVSHGQCLHVWLPENIFQLMWLVCCVDCYNCCTYFCSCKHVGQPFRDIFRPYADVVAFLNSDSQHSLSEIVNSFVKFLICKS